MIAREAGISSVSRLHYKVPDYIESLKNKNKKIEKLMAQIRFIIVNQYTGGDNRDLYGFTQDLSYERLKKYDDSFLVSILIKEKKQFAVSEDEMKKLLESVTSKNILGFYFDDFDGDNIGEAFAFTGDRIEEFNGTPAEVWFVNRNGAERIGVQVQYNESFILPATIWTIGNVKMLCVDEMGGAGDDFSHVWIVKNGVPIQLRNIHGKLSYDGGNNFSISHSSLGASTIDGSGRTWQCYYLYFNGNVFKEYGGIKISEKQLETITGAIDIIDSVKSKGGRITDIFYRQNGIVNINYVDGDTNRNLTMKLNGNTVEHFNDLDGEGIYKAALSPKIATYPDRFPF